jgi:hypothetical protein
MNQEYRDRVKRHLEAGGDPKYVNVKRKAEARHASSPARSEAMEKKKESTKERHVRYAKEDRFTKGMHEMNSRNHIQIDN